MRAPARPRPLALVLAALCLAAAAGCAIGDDAGEEQAAAAKDTVDRVIETVKQAADSALRALAEPPQPPPRADGDGATTVIGDVPGGTTVTANGRRLTFRDGRLHIDTVPQGTGFTLGPGAEIGVGGHEITVGADGGLRVDGTPLAVLERAAMEAGDTAGVFLAAEEALWKPVKRWSGTGDKVTESFRVGSGEWRVVYGGRAVRRGAWQGVRVLNRDGVQVASMNRDGAGTDTSYVHRGPGIFYLEVNSGASAWTVAVEEKGFPAERITPP